MVRYITKKEGIMVNTITRNLKNKDGSVDTILINSNDVYEVKLNKRYKLVGYTSNKFTDSFKNSILGMDVGTSSKGFARMTIISTIIAISLFLTLYIIFMI